MNVEFTSRGFEKILDKEGKMLVQQSSAVGDYDDAFDRPGSSYLWVGENTALDREQVAELRDHLNNWLKTGYLGRGE